MRDTKEEKEGDQDRQMDTDTKKIMFWVRGKGGRNQVVQTLGFREGRIHLPTHTPMLSLQPSFTQQARSEAGWCQDGRREGYRESARQLIRSRTALGVTHPTQVVRRKSRFWDRRACPQLSSSLVAEMRGKLKYSRRQESLDCQHILQKPTPPGPSPRPLPSNQWAPSVLPKVPYS